MSNEKETFIGELANGNPANLEMLKKLEQQLDELKRAGIAEPSSDYTLDRPLGRLTNVRPPGTLANTK